MLKFLSDKQNLVFVRYTVIIQCNQYVTMFSRVITLKLLSDKQNLVFVRVYSVINM